MRVLWRTSWLLIFAMGLSACEVSFSRGHGPPATITPLSQEQRAEQFFNSFVDKDFTSIIDAEQVAGYHIPQPASEYPRAFNSTTLRWFSGEKRPTAESQYTYVPLAPSSIGLVVGPAYDWNTKNGTSGEDVLSYGDRATIGSREGWLVVDDVGFKFSFHCGSVDGVAVWCIVRSSNKVGRAAFDEFVSSIQ